MFNLFSASRVAHSGNNSIITTLYVLSNFNTIKSLQAEQLLHDLLQLKLSNPIDDSVNKP